METTKNLNKNKLFIQSVLYLLSSTILSSCTVNPITPITQELGFSQRVDDHQITPPPLSLEFEGTTAPPSPHYPHPQKIGDGEVLPFNTSDEVTLGMLGGNTNITYDMLPTFSESEREVVLRMASIAALQNRAQLLIESSGEDGRDFEKIKSLLQDTDLFKLMLSNIDKIDDSQKKDDMIKSYYSLLNAISYGTNSGNKVKERREAAIQCVGGIQIYQYFNYFSQVADVDNPMHPLYLIEGDAIDQLIKGDNRYVIEASNFSNLLKILQNKNLSLIGNNQTVTIVFSKPSDTGHIGELIEINGGPYERTFLLYHTNNENNGITKVELLSAEQLQNMGAVGLIFNNKDPRVKKYTQIQNRNVLMMTSQNNAHIHGIA